ncbi:acetolactate synthase small subunit [Bacillus shivajii]|uniref:acetolactate synthase small subunit n=1 Tax=Bacillus shivajii TaxID=1983719 RepID=UPI001CFA1CA7|nr:acetolactate synthase small subunit [Bacillus shivajii]UCZ53190.1 acetolactate synthase small subunit [Bacillus shivajii]
MKRTLSIVVTNQLGVLNRVTSLFLKKGFNIDSLSVAPIDDQETSLMTIVVNVKEEKVVQQIKKQLDKQIDVLNITDISEQFSKLTAQQH